MAYWLFKSEPTAYPWHQLVKEKRTNWSGVRNHQASNNMKAMKLGDKAFFYHSSFGKEVVGIVQVVKTYYPNPADVDGFGQVDVEPVQALRKTVKLAKLKAHPVLQNMAMIRQPRLSVTPITEQEWQEICKLGGI